MEQFVLDDSAVYFPSVETLVVSDVHLGVVSRTNTYPEPEYSSIESRLNSLLNTYEPNRLVFNGDTFGHFPIPDEAETVITRIIEDGPNSVIFLVGNHEETVDNFPQSIRSSYSVKMEDNVGSILFYHGHRTPTTPVDTHVIGHCHPMVEGKKALMYSEDAYYGSTVFVLPAFSEIVGGSEFTESTGLYCPVLSDGISRQKYISKTVD